MSITALHPSQSIITLTRIAIGHSWDRWRVNKLVQAIAATVFTCLLGLAFQRVRDLWSCALTGKEIKVVKQKVKAPLTLLQHGVIENAGQSCYIGACLQCLKIIPECETYLRKTLTKRPGEQDERFALRQEIQARVLQIVTLSKEGKCVSALEVENLRKALCRMDKRINPSSGGFSHIVWDILADVLEIPELQTIHTHKIHRFVQRLTYLKPFTEAVHKPLKKQPSEPQERFALRQEIQACVLRIVTDYKRSQCVPAAEMEHLHNAVSRFSQGKGQLTDECFDAIAKALEVSDSPPKMHYLSFILTKDSKQLQTKLKKMRLVNVPFVLPIDICTSGRYQRQPPLPEVQLECGGKMHTFRLAAFTAGHGHAHACLKDTQTGKWIRFDDAATPAHATENELKGYNLLFYRKL